MAKTTDVCVACEHVVGPKTGKGMLEHSCAKTRSTNIVTGEPDYDYCTKARKGEAQCENFQVKKEEKE